MQLQATGKEIVIESAGYGAGGTNPDLIVLSNGQLLATWSEVLGQPTDDVDDTDGGIFARILSADGVAVGDIIQVNPSPTFPQSLPQAVALSGGSFAIGWTQFATFGDGPSDADTFVRFFDADGTPFEGLLIDVVPDTPSSTAETQDDQVLREIIPLDGNRFDVILEKADGPTGVTSKLYDSTGNFLEDLTFPTDDMLQTENGNIVRAAVVNKQVQVVLGNDLFGAPAGIDGVHEQIVFQISGDSTKAKVKGSTELASLTGGGFVIAYIEEVDVGKSVVRVAVISDEGRLEFERKAIPLDFDVVDPRADFDMIGLAGGGFAIAVTTLDAGGTSTGVDVALFDSNGKLETRLQASATDAGNQANPVLAQLPDGRIAVSFTDASGTGNAGDHNPLRIAYFEIDGASGKFVGTAGDDTLGGVGGNDRIFGLDGDDVIRGRDGDDRLFGGEGDDTLDGGTGADALRGGAGADTLRGGKGHDGLGGGEGNDTLKGDAGHDVIGGGGGNDRLFGNAGNDRLKGGTGNDTMTGGAGMDTFHFVRGMSGDDRITDFDKDEDVIAVNLRGANQSIVEVTISAGNTEIAIGADTLTLTGVTLTEAEIAFQFV